MPVILSTENIRAVGRAGSIECEMEVRDPDGAAYFVNAIFSIDGTLMTVAR